MNWLEKQIFSVKDVKKIILLTCLLSNPNLVEECGLGRSKKKSLQDSSIKSLTKTIDEYYEEQKNEDESILELFYNIKWKNIFNII